MVRFTPRRLRCEVFGSGGAVQIDQQTVYASNGAIVCGPKLPGSTILLLNLIVVEVSSPSAAAVDHGRKPSGYFSIPSMQHCLILDPERRVVLHRKRVVGDALQTRVLTDGAARRDPPGFGVAVEALFPQPKA